MRSPWERDLPWPYLIVRLSYSNPTAACCYHSSIFRQEQISAHLAVFVFDNQIYSGTRISEPTATAGKTSLELIAKGSGIDDAITVRDIEEFKKAAASALNEHGLKFIVAKVGESRGHRKIQRTNMDLLENKYQFVRYLEKTEGKPIFLGRG
jgi:hypothetical protein